MTRRRLPVVIILALRPRRPGGRRRLAAGEATREGARGPARLPSQDGRDRLRPGDRRDAVRRARGALAGARLEREAGRHLRRPAWARARLPDRDRRPRPRAAERHRLAWDTSLLVGHGDPTLSSADLAELAAQVRAAGITRVTGGVFGDETFFDTRRTAPGWKSWYYVNESAPLSALTVDRGRLPRPDLARTRRWRRRCSSATLCGGPVSQSAAQGSATRTATRCRSRLWTRAPLSEIVEVHGPPERQLHGRARAQAAGRDRERGRHQRRGSRLRPAPARRGRRTARGRAARRRLRALAARPPHRSRARVDPARGLGRPRACGRRSWRRCPWPGSAARSPTACAVLPLAGNVLAKTGTTFQASALSGYVKRRYVFSVLQNGNPVSSFWARRAQDRFATALAAQ